MKTHKLSLLLILLSPLVIISCKKEVLSNEEKTQKLDQSLVYKFPTTPLEKQLVENLGKVTNLLKVLYKDISNLKEVNATIHSKAYSDESISLRDLIYFENSPLSRNKKFCSLCQQKNIKPGSFGQNFWKEVSGLNDPSFQQFLDNLKNTKTKVANGRVGDIGDDVTIYFPYSDNVNFTDDPITNLVTATADADEGWGQRSYYNYLGQLQWTQVLVNDEYAFNHPTQIVGVNGIDDLEYVVNPADPPPPPPAGVSRLYIGEAICKHQYDHLISFTGNGGGSEIKFCHLSGYLQPANQQVTSFQDIASVNFSRGDIRNQRKLRAYTVWDDDWPVGDLEQVLAIYEEDNTNTVTFNGSLGTTLTSSPGNTVTGSIGYNITRQSQDDIIRELKISRSSFFAGAFRDQGWGFSSDITFIPPPVSHGWPYYDGGADVTWTWPYNTY